MNSRILVYLQDPEKYFLSTFDSLLDHPHIMTSFLYIKAVCEFITIFQSLSFHFNICIAGAKFTVVKWSSGHP